MDNIKTESKCHTHTYLTRSEESKLADLILSELTSVRETGRLTAPAGMCDLIF